MPAQLRHERCQSHSIRRHDAIISLRHADAMPFHAVRRRASLSAASATLMRCRLLAEPLRYASADVTPPERRFEYAFAAAEH